MKYSDSDFLPTGRVEAVLSFIARQIESFSKHRLYVNLACAFAATSCASCLFYVVSTASDPFNLSRFLKHTLIALLSYLAVTLFFHRFWTGTLNRILPIWILITVIGGLLSETAGSLEWFMREMNDPQVRTMFPTFNDFLLYQTDMALGLVLFQSLITLPVTGVVYYAGTIVQALRYWHNRPEFNFSILSKEVDETHAEPNNSLNQRSE